MDVMSIAGLSTDMSQSKVMTAVSTAMLAKSLDMMETAGAGVVDLIERSTLENSVNPNLGGNIDIMV